MSDNFQYGWDDCDGRDYIGNLAGFDEDGDDDVSSLGLAEGKGGDESFLSIRSK